MLVPPPFHSGNSFCKEKEIWFTWLREYVDKLWKTEHLRISELPLFLCSFSRSLNLLYYLCFYVSWVKRISISPFESCRVATDGNDDSTGLSHTVKGEWKATAADYHFSRCPSTVQVALVVNYKCRSFPSSNGKLDQGKAMDDDVPSTYRVSHKVQGYKNLSVLQKSVNLFQRQGIAIKICKTKPWLSLPMVGRKAFIYRIIEIHISMIHQHTEFFLA